MTRRNLEDGVSLGSCGVALAMIFALPLLGLDVAPKAIDAGITNVIWGAFTYQAITLLSLVAHKLLPSVVTKD